MQTKHLHGLLLILLLLGCGGDEFTAENPYLAGSHEIVLQSASTGAVPAMFFGPLDVRTAAESSEPFIFQYYPHTRGQWTGGLSVDGFDHRAVRVSRTLTSLVIEDTTSGLRCVATVLPNGSGLAFYLEGETYSAVRFALAPPGIKDTLFLSGFKDDDIESYQLKDSTFFAVAATPGFADEFNGHGYGSDIRRELAEGKRRQVVLAFDRNEKAALALAETYRGVKRAKLERMARDSLAGSAAFMLHTEDERTNGAHALLTAALVRAGGRLTMATPAEVETSAAMSRALFLASRERSPVAFGGSAGDLARRVRWGAEAYRAAFAYGMAGEDSLRIISLAALAEVARLSADYAGDLFALGDETIVDTLTKLAVAHVRYAELLSLCGDLSVARGNRTAEGNFRQEALRASKAARKFFQQADKVYAHAYERDAQVVLADVMEEELDSVDMPLTVPATMSIDPPDTQRYVHAGAHYGFTWLAQEPPKLVPATLDGFTWQKWTAHRFATDLKITQTPDLDSLLTLLLDGPVPGALTTDPGYDGEPSLSVMAAAYENLAELYLGVQPNLLQQRVDILPRPPQNWGRTAARVPVGSGLLDLDFDFANSLAHVGMTNVDRPLDVYFGFPLPTGGFGRTQFTLSPDEPRVKIRMERDAENRVRVIVKPA